VPATRRGAHEDGPGDCAASTGGVPLEGASTGTRTSDHPDPCRLGGATCSAALRMPASDHTSARSPKVSPARKGRSRTRRTWSFAERGVEGGMLTLRWCVSRGRQSRCGAEQDLHDGVLSVGPLPGGVLMTVRRLRGALFGILAALCVAGHAPVSAASAGGISDGSIQSTAPLLSDRGIPAVPVLRIAAPLSAPASHPGTGAPPARAGAAVSSTSQEALTAPAAVDRRLPPFFCRVSYRTTGPPLRAT
jgi:hypothetical protein